MQRTKPRAATAPKSKKTAKSRLRKEGAGPREGADLELERLRGRIDALDTALLGLLSERADIASAVGKLKAKAARPSFHDPKREERVLARVAKHGAGRFPERAIRNVFREIMSGCLAVEDALRVAFLGPQGTFSQMAAKELFGLSARYVESTSIDGVVDSVLRGDAVYGVVPFENSTEGSVGSTHDLLLESDVYVRAEHVVPIAQSLLSRAPSLGRIERVYSHPQALGQCRLWLAKHTPRAQLVQTASTALAVQEAEADEAAAAVGSALAGQLLGVPVLRAVISDRPENATRFFVLGKGKTEPTGNDRTTLVFTAPDDNKKGALRRVLSLFEAHDVNLTRIESRPSRQRAWDYVFFADVLGHEDDANLRAALAKLRRTTKFVKVCGSYPVARGSL